MAGDRAPFDGVFITKPLEIEQGYIAQTEGSFCKKDDQGDDWQPRPGEEKDCESRCQMKMQEMSTTATESTEEWFDDCMKQCREGGDERPDMACEPVA